MSTVVNFGEATIHIAAETHLDLVLMDSTLNGDMGGVQAAEHMRDCFNIPVIYDSANADEQTLQRAKKTEV